MMTSEKDQKMTQQIAELEKSIYQIQVAIVQKTTMKSMLEERNSTYEDDIKTRTDAETKFEESINQIQDAIDAQKVEQQLRQSQMHETSSSEKKKWLTECIVNLQKSITHLEQGLRDRRNNLTEIETTFSQLEQEFVNNRNTIEILEKSITHLEQGLKDRQNALLRIKEQM